MERRGRFPKEVRERSVRLVFEQQEQHESQWAAICSIAGKMGCSPQTLHKWVGQAENDAGKRPGLTTSERERVKELERENRELKRANEILRKASAYFAQAELDRRQSDDQLYRKASGGIRGRADLRSSADCPVDIPRARSQEKKSRTATCQSEER